MTQATGLRILEVGRSVAGAYCGWLLRSMGAKVSRASLSEPGADNVSAALGILNAGKEELRAEDVAAALGEVDAVITDDATLLEEIVGMPLEKLAERMPGKVLGVASVYGLTGPLSQIPAAEIDAQAISSVSWVLGEVGREPLTIPPEVLATQAGAHLAAAILAALMVPGDPQRARVVDIALADVLAAYVAVNCRFYIHHGMRWARSGRRASDSGGAYPFVILPCKDGQVCLSGRTKGEWLRLLEALGHPAWADDPRYRSLRRMGREYPEEVDALLLPQLEAMTKAEIADMANRHRLTISPVRSFAEVLDTEQFALRGFWRETEVGGRRVKVPGLPFVARDRRAEGAPPITESLLSGLLEPPASAHFDRRRPLAGLRIVDLGWVWSAPQVSGILAQFGADVIKVEHGERIDSMRMSGTVIVDGKTVEGDSINMSPMFHQINRGKRGITLNLKEPRAVELLRRLIAESGIVVENMSPGSLERAGLGFADLREVCPDLIMLSMSGAGQFGPLADMRTYAPVMSSFAGLEALIGYPGEEPVGALNFALGDPNAAVHGLTALFAALLRRRATGEACYIDLSQTEALLATLTPFLVEAQVSNAQPKPRGNAQPGQAASGIYPSADPDGWLTVSVRTAAERATLEQLLSGAPTLTEWTRRHTTADAVVKLRNAGIPAAPVNDINGLWTDPQFSARGLFSDVDLPAMGAVPLAGPPWRIAGFEPPTAPRGPKLGEHNDEVFRGLLGLGPAEIETLKASGVIS